MLTSFRSKVLFLFSGLIVLAQISTAVAVLLATKTNLVEQAGKELEVGVRVFEQLLETRAQQLLNSVQVLSSDFGFRQAVATDDLPTIRSVLENHGDRVQADLMLLIDSQGRITASNKTIVTTGQDFAYPDLLKTAQQQGTQAVVLLNGLPYQVVVVPVRAPLTVGWLCIGFMVDDVLAQELKAITKLEVSFWGNDGAEHTPYLASTLATEERQLLYETLQRDDKLLHAMSEPQLPDLPYVTYVRDLSIANKQQITAYLQGSLRTALLPYRQLELQLIVLTAAALLLSLLTAAVFARGITRPVGVLVEAAERIESGVYDRAIELSGRDELARLAATFNRMQRGIASREQRILHQAYHDELTGLPNRAMLKDRFEMAIARATRARGSFAVMHVDLDRFKEVNDALGTQAGDDVLRSIGQRLLRLIRNTDTVVRLGGDEFLILLEDTTQQQALTLATKIGQGLTEPIAVFDRSIKLSASLGIALYPEHGEAQSMIMRRAGIAMLSAKKAHLGVCIYQQGQDEEHLRKIELIKDLELAIQDEQFYLQYQPKVDIKTELVQQLEALLRWKHPQLGFVSPDEFIALAESSGHIHNLTRLVIRKSIQQIRQWLDEGLTLSVAINLSALDLMESDLTAMISDTLAAHAVPASALILEITESTVVQDTERALRVLRELKQLGLHLAIDDYGTGHSSLAQLKRMPFDELKIDKSFVLNLDKSPDDALIVKSTIELAHKLGLSVIAEGVETAQAWALLAEYACDLVQGYYISRPLPAQEVAAWVTRHNANVRSRALPYTDFGHTTLAG